MPNAKVGVLADLAAAGPLPAAADQRQRYPRGAGLSAPGDRAPRSARRRPGHLPLSRRSPKTGPAAGKRWEWPPNSPPACWWRGCSARWNSRWVPPCCCAPRICGRIGGFAAIGDYLADDYQLGRAYPRPGPARGLRPGRRRDAPGRRHLGRSLAPPTALVARHPRIAAGRLFRLSGHSRHVLVPGGHRRGRLAGRRGGARHPHAGRNLGGLGRAARFLRARRAWWIPFRDLWGFAIWVCGLAGNTVEWRGTRIRLSPDGKIR